MSYQRVAMAVLVLLGITAGDARAQDPGPIAAGGSAPFTRTWIVLGGGSTTLLGDCTDCAADTYLHSGAVLGNAGVSLNRRADFGGEVFWTRTTLSTGDRIQVTFLMASVQFRPWARHGFFVKAGSGMAFLRNWLNEIETSLPPTRSKAFALAIGGGWEWRAQNHLGLQVFGTQHAASLGDFQTSVRTVENVMANFWSVGAAVAIR